MVLVYKISLYSNNTKITHNVVGCTVSEPDPGWMENMNGPSGIVTGVSIGFLRAIPIDTNKVADIIPVDYTVNALISVMWDTVNRYVKF